VFKRKAAQKNLKDFKGKGSDVSSVVERLRSEISRRNSFSG
jgi:hypothetical protein